MKKYLNKATGVEVIVPCALEGPDWEEVTEAKQEDTSESKIVTGFGDEE